MSENLEEVRMQMKKFIDTLKIESRLKKQKAGKQSARENSSEIINSEQTTAKEQDDISRFINMVIEDYNATELDKLQGKQSRTIDLVKKPVLKGPHHHGAFITGDFLSETVTRQNRLPSHGPNTINLDEVSEKNIPAPVQAPQVI